MAVICWKVDTHRLKYFLRIADEGSITGAAMVLGVAQPALSRQLRLLEEDLGVTLFRRTRRGVELTDEGERLRASTAAPLRQLELAVQYAGSPLARIERGLRLGMPESAVELLAVPLIASLTTVFPKVSFSVTAGSTDELVEAMLKGSVDVALINPVPDDRVFYRPLLEEDLVLVGGPDSGLDAGRPVTFSELVDFPMTVPRSRTGVGVLLENAALRQRVLISYAVTTDSLAVTKSLIAAGLAYGVLPQSSCITDFRSGRLLFAPICDPPLTQQWGVAATAQLDLPSEFAASIGDTIRAEVAGLVMSGRWPARRTFDWR